MTRSKPNILTPLRGASLAAALLIAGGMQAANAADMIGNCEMTGTKGSMPVTPVNPG
jgi:hypothetical protein